MISISYHHFKCFVHFVYNDLAFNQTDYEQAAQLVVLMFQIKTGPGWSWLLKEMADLNFISIPTSHYHINQLFINLISPSPSPPLSSTTKLALSVL